jgi:hypothetical protein
MAKHLVWKMTRKTASSLKTTFAGRSTCNFLCLTCRASSAWCWGPVINDDIRSLFYMLFIFCLTVTCRSLLRRVGGRIINNDIHCQFYMLFIFPYGDLQKPPASCWGPNQNNSTHGVSPLLLLLLHYSCLAQCPWTLVGGG